MIDVTLTEVEELKPYSVFAMSTDETTLYKTLDRPDTDYDNDVIRIPVVRVEAMGHPSFANKLAFKVIPNTLQAYEFDDSDEVYVFTEQD
jgi:hypothetical protein